MSEKRKRVYNFSAGPAMLPKAVLEKVEQELLDWNHLGVSVMEVSHRGKEFMELAKRSERDLRELMTIPDNYSVLFCQGGARGQFAAIPLNLLGDKVKATYVDGGEWAASAISEARKYCQDIEVISAKIETPDGRIGILPASEWVVSDDSAYLHFTPNETIDGIEINELPDTDKPIIADMSSTILSRNIDVSRYGMIYAGAQKNIGPAGLVVVIIRNDLLDLASNLVPSIVNYRLQASKGSMYNTPPTFAWYLAAEVFQWLKTQGGLEQMEQVNRAKAKLLYDYIDASSFYSNKIASDNRSLMNVPFQLVKPELDALFLEESNAQGLLALKGHVLAGGMRASIYNAMPIEGVKALIDFMDEFANQHQD